MARYRRRSFQRYIAQQENKPVPKVAPIYRHHQGVAEYCALQVHAHNEWMGEWGTRNVIKLGGMTREQCIDICESGRWDEGVARMQKELEGFEVPAARSIKRKAVWADQGDSLDIHRVFNGQLDAAWRRTKRRQMPATRQVVITFPLFVSWMHSAEKLFWCGAAALKLADLLTEAGYSVAIIGVHGTTNNGNYCYDSLTVKTADQPLDINAVVVAMAFPGFSRTMGFKALMSIPFPITSGLGTAIYDATEPLEALGYLPEECAHGLFAEVDSKSSARAWIEKQLARFAEKGEL